MLQARPGIAGPTQLLVEAWEAELLRGPDAQTVYRDQVLPVKLAVDAWYVEHATPWIDLLVGASLVQRFVLRAACLRDRAGYPPGRPRGLARLDGNPLLRWKSAQTRGEGRGMTDTRAPDAFTSAGDGAPCGLNRPDQIALAAARSDVWRAQLASREHDLGVGLGTVLEIGCATGAVARWACHQGAHVVLGLDLHRELLVAARAQLPTPGYLVADARALPVPDGAIDIAICSTLFSSVLDETVARDIAREIDRVVVGRRHGVVVRRLLAPRVQPGAPRGRAWRTSPAGSRAGAVRCGASSSLRRWRAGSGASRASPTRSRRSRCCERTTRARSRVGKRAARVGARARGQTSGLPKRPRRKPKP